MRVTEYDAFGPWIYEIDEDHPLPRLFAPYVERPETYRMLFKVPRDIERRKATPDMDLYDYVIGVDDSGIRVWSRREKAVETAYLPFREIGGVRLYQWLLKGVCSIYGSEETITLPYNTVSADIFWKLLDMVRQTWPQEAALPCDLQSDTGLAEEQVDIWLYNQMRDLRERGIPFASDAYQPSVSPGQNQRNFAGRCIFIMTGSSCFCAAASRRRRGNRSTARSLPPSPGRRCGVCRWRRVTATRER